MIGLSKVHFHWKKKKLKTTPFLSASFEVLGSWNWRDKRRGLRKTKISPKSIMTTSPMKSRRSEIGRSSAFRSVFHTLPRPTASTSCTSCNCWLRAMRLPKRTNGDEKKMIKMENPPKKVCMLYKCGYLWTCSYTWLHDYRKYTIM